MIECKNITKIYYNGDNETVALRDVSFKIDEGEFVAIMGHSGSGKSTLMHILGALDVPTKGTYFLNGKDVSKLSDDKLAEIRMRKIGFVFQTFNLLPRTTVIRNVTLPLIYNEVPPKERRAKAEIALNSVGIIKERWENLSNQISGGQVQRVAIARALVNKPSLILADEPTGNLDTKTGHKVMKTLQKLNREKNHTIILITHEKEIAAYADRAILLKDGGIIEDKTINKQT